jgi:competence protein ComEA
MFTPRLITVFSEETSYQLSHEEVVFYKKTFHSKRQNRYPSQQERRRYKLPPSKFNPDTYSLKEWMYLGLSEKQANAVVRFCSRGIRSTEDLQKIFVMPNELYLLIKDSVVITSRPKSPYSSYNLSKSQNQQEKLMKSIELNTSTQSDLESVPGIGPFFAKQIIKYRDQLGGFYSKEQLLEVWKMDQEKYLKIEKYLIVDPGKIKKINLNSVTIEQLNLHPYLNWNQANSIVKIREQKRGFKQIDELKQSVLISKDLFEKLKHYLVH